MRRNIITTITLIVLLLSSSISSIVFAEDSTTVDLTTLSPKEQIEEIQSQMDAIDQEIADYQTQSMSNITSDILACGFTNGGFQYLDGDIIVTQSTFLKGLTGHAGIVCGNGILEITPKNNDGHPALISTHEWFRKYPSVMVMRYVGHDGKKTIPQKAGWYAKTFYVDGQGKYSNYKVFSPLSSTTEDYCSGLVWKCYYRGAGLNFKVFRKGEGYVTPNSIVPYDFINARRQNNFSAVYRANWD